MAKKCEEISNDREHAKLYCNLKCKNAYGIEMEENSKFDMIKENGVWKIKI